MKMQQQLVTGASASPGCSCYDDVITITGQYSIAIKAEHINTWKSLMMLRKIILRKHPFALKLSTPCVVNGTFQLY
jgi:hypothetical protein